MPFFDELEIESAVLELRYTNSFALWDCSGRLWTELETIFPGLTPGEIQPNQQIFETEMLQLTVQLDNCKFESRGRDAVKAIISLSSLFCRTVARNLRLQTFTRVGFRVISSKKFSTFGEAMSYARPMQASSKGPEHLEEWQETGFVHASRIESAASGMFAVLKLEEQRVAVIVPWSVRSHLDSLTKSSPAIISDTDYYTIGLVEYESFDSGEWARQAHRAMRRYWEHKLNV